MIIYYVAINSPYFQSKKTRFACRCEVDKYIESEKDNLIFSDVPSKEEFDKLPESLQQLKRMQAFDIFSVDTNKCKKYKRMFPSKSYKEALCV